MGLRASETAELVLEDCRVPEENLLGGEESYHTKEGFMTAMKTFDNTRPLVAAMAIGIGRAAYEYARDFVKENYVLSRPIPRYAAIAERLARVGRGLEAARMLTWRAAWMADEGEPNAKEASMSQGDGRAGRDPRVHRGDRDLRRRGLDREATTSSSRSGSATSRSTTSSRARGRSSAS